MRAKLNFSGPWENISTLWQYLFLQLYKTLPNLTLPDQFSIPFPNPAGGTHPSPAEGLVIPAPNPKIKLAARLFFKNFPKFGKNELGTAKIHLCQINKLKPSNYFINNPF